MSWENVEKNIEKGPMGLAKMIFYGILIIGAIVVAVNVIFKPAEILSNVTNADRALYNYEYFHNKSQSYKAIKVKVAIATKSVTRFNTEAGPRAEWSYEDKTEYARLNTIADGLLYQCNDIVADYNAKTEQVTRNIFKTDSTPYKLQECN